MLKEIKIDKKTVGIDNSCGFLIIYLNQFDSDPLKDIAEFKKDIMLSKNESRITLLKLLWALAKNYNKKIGVPEKWLKNFKIDYYKLAIEIFEILTAMLRLGEESNSRHSDSNEEQELTTTHLIASAIAYGFSIKEFSKMELRNYIKICKSYAEIKGYGDEEEREATQEDFDRF